MCCLSCCVRRDGDLSHELSCWHARGHAGAQSAPESSSITSVLLIFLFLFISSQALSILGEVMLALLFLRGNLSAFIRIIFLHPTYAFDEAVYAALKYPQASFSRRTSGIIVRTGMGSVISFNLYGTSPGIGLVARRNHRRRNESGLTASFKLSSNTLQAVQSYISRSVYTAPQGIITQSLQISFSQGFFLICFTMD